jgi:hypothetical protein
MFRSVHRVNAAIHRFINQTVKALPAFFKFSALVSAWVCVVIHATSSENNNCWIWRSSSGDDIVTWFVLLDCAKIGMFILVNLLLNTKESLI